MKKTITVLVPALNEEANIENAAKNILSAINGHFADYEILLFNDGSTDKTGEIIDSLAAENPKIKAIHNGINRGFGYNFNKGVELAKMNYISILPGDNEISRHSIEEMFKLVGTADIIVPYTINTEVRPRSRRIISGLYIFIMNLLFDCNLHYYTGPAIHKTCLLRKVPLKINDFAFMSAILVRLIRAGHSFIEAPMYIHNRVKGRSKAFKTKNIISVMVTILKLFAEIYMFQQNRYRNFNVNRLIPNVMLTE